MPASRKNAHSHPFNRGFKVAGIQRAAKESVKVVAVNIEDREQFRKVAKALSTLTLQLTLQTTHDYRKKSSDAYGVHGIPHLVLIGRDGKVISVHRGYSEESIDSIIEEINGALAIPAPAKVVARLEQGSS